MVEFNFLGFIFTLIFVNNKLNSLEIHLETLSLSLTFQNLNMIQAQSYHLMVSALLSGEDDCQQSKQSEFNP